MEAVMTYSQAFFGWLLQTTLIASLVICLILLIQKLLGGRLGPRWSYALWLVLLIRMILPWSPSSRVSLSNLIASWKGQTQSLQSHGTVEVQEISPHEQAAEAPETITSQEAESELVTREQAAPRLRMVSNAEAQSGPWLVLLRRILPIVWLAGAMVIGAYLLISNLALWRIVKRDHPLINQSILELFEECKAQMGVQSLVVVVPSDRVRSPGLFGFVRPRLLLPRQMLDSATTEEMRYVFLHELAHLRRHDIYFGWLTSLLQVLHWFNPLVWFAFYRMRADRELACDALVLTRTGQDKSQEYGGAIVELVKRFSRSRPLPAMAGIIESKSQLKRRIAMITEFRNKSYRFSPLAVILIVILACFSLPDAKRTIASETQALAPTNQPKFTKIRIPTIPQNGILSPDGKNLVFISDESVWTIPLHGKVDPDIAGEPIRLANVPGIWDYWNLMALSADGKWIAVNSGADANAVHVIPVSDGKSRRIQLPNRGGHVWSYRVSLSPNGQSLAFSALSLASPRQASEKRERYIYTIPTAGGETKQVSLDGARLPSFSSDGRFIAYIGEGDLWIVPSSGGAPSKLTAVVGRLRGPVWSPDGKYIASHHEPLGGNDSDEIWVFRLSPDVSSAGEPVKIALPGNSGHILAGWTPRNELGVFIESKIHTAIYKVASSGGRAVQVTPEGRPYYPTWSPDGQRIYFRWFFPENDIKRVQDLQAGHEKTAYVSATGGNPVGMPPVQSEGGLGVLIPGGGHKISPDGTRIVVSAANGPSWNPQKGLDIWTVPVDGGLATRLTNDTSRESYPCWSPDGEWIAFVDSHVKSDNEEFKAIYIIPAKGGKTMQVSSEMDDVGGGAIAFSPDGERIAFFSEGSIKTVPFKGGQAKVLVNNVRSGKHSQLAYSPDGLKIANNAEGKIWITRLSGEGSEELQTGLPKNARLDGFDWSPDGEKIVFVGTIGGESEFWLIENFLPQAIAMGK
jgi:beta-lactamase regulating signal transducer with metallopeptidase domain/Tol biopolymer transport system component